MKMNLLHLAGVLFLCSAVYSRDRSGASLPAACGGKVNDSDVVPYAAVPSIFSLVIFLVLVGDCTINVASDGWCPYFFAQNLSGQEYFT